jgi:lipopolysaccharide/colanic/teichoic acid biosynthesis glycosyltransferase
VISPVVMELAGPRMHIRPLADLPFLHLERPEFTGMRRVIKTVFDYSVAMTLLLLLSPLLLVVAVLIRVTSPGPAFFRQNRLGVRGKEFKVWKFRTMAIDAEARKLDLANETDGKLFKVKADPRITPLGKWLRRFSIDELPQLFNVLNGSMSLVGPRPLPEKLEDFDFAERRRLLVKPGNHRPLAGERAVRPLMGGERAARPLLRGELVARTRRADPAANRRGSRPAARGLLTEDDPCREAC